MLRMRTFSPLQAFPVRIPRRCACRENNQTTPQRKIIKPTHRSPRTKTLSTMLWRMNGSTADSGGGLLTSEDLFRLGVAGGEGSTDDVATSLTVTSTEHTTITTMLGPSQASETDSGVDSTPQKDSRGPRLQTRRELTLAGRLRHTASSLVYFPQHGERQTIFHVRNGAGHRSRSRWCEMRDGGDGALAA